MNAKYPRIDQGSLKKFLEETPLYTWWRVLLPEYVHEFPHVISVDLQCPQCKTLKTFPNSKPPDIQLMNYHQSGVRIAELSSEPKDLKFLCGGCGDVTAVFYIEFSRGKPGIRKVGQYPEWNIQTKKEVKDYLGEDDEELWKRGLICESQGYGIGAFAYFRRVLENIINDLIDDIITHLRDTKTPQEVIERFENAKAEPVMKTKVGAIKDELPGYLRPGGINPLDRLFSILSEGLHGKSEEECIKSADDIRECLEYLIEHLAVQKRAREKFKKVLGHS